MGDSIAGRPLTEDEYANMKAVALRTIYRLMRSRKVGPREKLGCANAILRYGADDNGNAAETVDKLYETLQKTVSGNGSSVGTGDEGDSYA